MRVDTGSDPHPSRGERRILEVRFSPLFYYIPDIQQYINWDLQKAKTLLAKH